MEPWLKELYLQHGLFDNLRAKYKTVSNGAKKVANTVTSNTKKAVNAATSGHKNKVSLGNTGREWKNHKYIRKEGNRYIYKEDLKKKSLAPSSNHNNRTSVKKNTNGSSISNKKATVVLNNDSGKSKTINTSLTGSGKNFVNKVLESEAGKKVKTFFKEWFGEEPRYFDNAFGKIVYDDYRFGVYGNGLNKAQEALLYGVTSVIYPFLSKEDKQWLKENYFTKDDHKFSMKDKTII